MTLQVANQFSLPSTPHCPHSPHSKDSTSYTSVNSTSPTLSGTNVRSIHRDRSFLVSAATVGLYVPRSCLLPHISQPSVFRPDVSCFTLVHHPVLHDDQQGLLLQATSYALKPQTIVTKGYRSVRLSVGQALPVSRYAGAHCCCCCTSAHTGGGPSSTTNERRLSPFVLDTQAS